MSVPSTTNLGVPVVWLAARIAVFGERGHVKVDQGMDLPRLVPQLSRGGERERGERGSHSRDCEGGKEDPHG